MIKHPAIRRFFYQLMMQKLQHNEFNFATFQKDYIAKEIFSSGLYENSLLQKLRKHFALDDKVGTIIDVGANIGNHTIFFSKLSEKVIAIEPNPACYYLIQANILANECKNVVVFNKAVSDTEGIAKLFFDYKHTGGGTINPTDLNLADKTFEVGTITLDSLLDQVDNVTCLKIDAEGHEAKIINGGRKLLSQEAPLVIFEAHNLTALKDTSHALRQVGYKYFYDITQSRRYSRYKYINILNYLFFPNNARVSQIDFTQNKAYQMVVAAKAREFL